MRPRPKLRFLVLATLCLVGTASSASAAQYCVGATGTACGGGSYAFDYNGLASAIAAAKATANVDEVRVAAGTINGVAPLTIDDPNGVTIAGTAAQGTTLKINSGAGAAITVTTGVSDLADLRISGAGKAGVSVNESGFLAPASTFDRLHLDGYTQGFQIAHTGFPGPSIRESVIDLGTIVLGRGIEAARTTPASTAVFFTAQRLTIGGRGSSQVGIDVAAVSGDALSGGIDDSVINLEGASSIGLKCSATAGSADLVAARTAFYPAAAYTPNGSSCDTAPTSIIDLFSSSIGFLDASAGDYHLASYSALIDKGTTTAPIQTTDLAGLPRYIDGNGDGTTAVDLGAYEYQRRVPNSPVITSPAPTQTTVAPGAAIHFAATATDPDPGDYTMISWDFGDGHTSNSSAPTYAYSALGTFTATATAEDPTGLKSTTQLTITVANSNVELATPAPTPKPPDPFATATGPRVRVLASPTQPVVRGSAGFSTVPATAPDAATLESAGAITLRVGLTRLVPGRKARGKCKAGAKKGKRCTARIAIPSIGQIPVSPGPVNLRFGGKLGGKRLPKGTYEVTVVPVGIDKRRGLPVTYRLTLR